MPALLLAIVSSLALMLGLQAAPLAPAALPDTPVGHRAKIWFDAVESADDAGLEAMIRDNLAPDLLGFFPMDDHVQMHLEIREDLLEVVSIERQREDHLTLLCRSTDGWASLQINVQPEPPHLIVGIGFGPAEAPDITNTSPADNDPDFAAALDEYVNALAADDEFSGTVLVCRDGEPIYSAAHGEASKRFHVPNTLDTKFNLGSANKLQTAIAINQLAEQGKLRYTDLVGDLLPDYPNDDLKSRVTVHHLLTHTGGTGSHFTPEFFETSKLKHRTLADFIPLIADNGVAFEPGSQMEYSNAGFMILGRIIEQVSGEPYYDYIRSHLTGPAHATNTDCYDLDIPVENLAEGYIPADEYDSRLDQGSMGDTIPGLSDSANAWRSNTFFHSPKGGPAGGGYSTVIDLNKIADAFMQGTLVSETTRDLMTTSHTPFGHSETTSYGYGMIIETQNDGLRSFGHGGDFLGIQTRYTIIPDTTTANPTAGYYTIAVMTNVAGQAARVYNHALRLLPRR